MISIIQIRFFSQHLNPLYCLAKCYILTDNTFFKDELFVTFTVVFYFLEKV